MLQQAEQATRHTSRVTATNSAAKMPRSRAPLQPRTRVHALGNGFAGSNLRRRLCSSVAWGGQSITPPAPAEAHALRLRRSAHTHRLSRTLRAGSPPAALVCLPGREKHNCLSVESWQAGGGRQYCVPSLHPRPQRASSARAGGQRRADPLRRPRSCPSHRPSFLCRRGCPAACTARRLRRGRAEGTERSRAWRQQRRLRASDRGARTSSTVTSHAPALK